MKVKNRHFTLLELIVVVAIIGILSAMAVPHFLEAQTRAKISSARSHVNLIRGALEAYSVDWNDYPAAASQGDRDPFGILCDVQLTPLTTPISYISPSAFRDPFGAIRQYPILARSWNSSGGSDFPIPEMPNPNRSLLYYNLMDFSRWTRNPMIATWGTAVVSLGPDQRDSFGAFAPFPSAALPPLARQAGILHPLDTLYDPTNGTISGGDLPGFAGEVSGLK